MKFTLRAKVILALRVLLAAFSLYIMREHFQAGNYDKVAIIAALTLLMFAPYIALYVRNRRKIEN